MKPAVTAGDSAGITGEGMTAADIPLAALAPHPGNPRGEDLGDLGELEASVREIGVLEPLVVVTAAAHQAGGWPDPGPGITHVVLAGHRRRAVAIAAGPGVIRDDLAGDDALVAMLAENDDGKRKGITPLAEARAFAQLAGRGWSQRRIAVRMGCKQPHVSKRLALLKLPAEALAALEAGQITTADAAELGRLADRPDRAAAALAEIGRASWDNAAAVVDRHLARARREETAAATRARLEAEGLKVVDPGRWAPTGTPSGSTPVPWNRTGPRGAWSVPPARTTVRPSTTAATRPAMRARPRRCPGGASPTAPPAGNATPSGPPRTATGPGPPGRASRPPPSSPPGRCPAARAAELVSLALIHRQRRRRLPQDGRRLAARRRARARRR